MTSTLSAPNLTPIAVDLHPTHSGAGRAILAPIVEPTVGDVVWLTTPDLAAAEYYGVPDRAGAVVGGLARVRGRWSPVAYTQRAHLFTSAGPVWFLPAATSRAHAARGLLRWWWYVGRQVAAGADVRDLNPLHVPAATRRTLFA